MVLARPLGFNTPFKTLVYYYLIGMFFNLFAPGTVGGDVSRIYYLARDGELNVDKKWGGATMHAAVSVFIDRVIGMAVLVWLGAAGLFLYPQYAIPATVRLVTYALAGAFVLGGVLLPVLRRILPADGHPGAVTLRVAVRSYCVKEGICFCFNLSVFARKKESRSGSCCSPSWRWIVSLAAFCSCYKKVRMWRRSRVIFGTHGWGTSLRTMHGAKFNRALT